MLTNHISPPDDEENQLYFPRHPLVKDHTLSQWYDYDLWLLSIFPIQSVLPISSASPILNRL